MILELIGLIQNTIIAYAIVLMIFFYFRWQKQRRRFTALDYIKRWNQELSHFQLLRDMQSKRDLSDLELDSVREESSGREIKNSELDELIRALNFFEELAIAVLFHEADEEMAKEFFFYSLVSAFRHSEPLIMKYRSRNRALYVNLERLYGKWAFDRKYILVRRVAK